MLGLKRVLFKLNFHYNVASISSSQECSTKMALLCTWSSLNSKYASLSALAQSQNGPSYMLFIL